MKTHAILIFAIIFTFGCKSNDPDPIPKEKTPIEDENPKPDEEPNPDDNNNPNPDLGDEVTWIDSTKYIYRMKDYIDSVSYGCYNYLHLKNTKARIVHGDMLNELDYYQSADTIILKSSSEIYGDYKFLVLHPDTIKKIPSNQLWIKRRK